MKTISLRLDEKTLAKSREIAESENLERSAALRQSIAIGLSMLSKKIAVEKYAQGEFSLSEAAKFAGVSAGEMTELLAQRGVKANYTLKDAEESYNRVGRFLEK